MYILCTMNLPVTYKIRLLASNGNDEVVDDFRPTKRSFKKLKHRHRPCRHDRCAHCIGPPQNRLSVNFSFTPQHTVARSIQYQ